ncbi:CarD family transcriptional regulator [Ferrovibrio sp.]|uniref:CarD family transcriptional regulator n=1 Tax=Ferrovibrio sp. TaxID=1917215 RepID=UPI002638679B|nr:CarD family transcriptional regulator [Ferrovibrio sp.]
MTKKTKVPAKAAPAKAKAAAKPAAKVAARAAAVKKPATVKQPAKATAKPAAKAPPAKAPAMKAPAAKAPAAKPHATKAKPAAKPPAKAAAKPAAKPAAAAPAKKKVETKPAAKVVVTAKATGKAAPLPPARPSRPMAVSAPPSRPLPQPVKPATPEPKPVQQAQKPIQLKPVPAKVKVDFSAGDHVVYPTHGVGKILRIERQMIAGFELDLMVVEFERDKMTVRVPLTKVNSVGIRKLSSPQKMRTALDTLKGRARIKRAMWSRRAQEYEAKINSGDPVSIAEVVRDLHRNAGQPDQSYSERQIYESALDRLVRELAAVERIDEDSATKKLEKILKIA